MAAVSFTYILDASFCTKTSTWQNQDRLPWHKPRVLFVLVLTTQHRVGTEKTEPPFSGGHRDGMRGDTHVVEDGKFPLDMKKVFTPMLDISHKCWTRAQRGCGIPIPRDIQNSNGQVPEQPALMDLLQAVAWTRDLQMPPLPHSNLRFRCGCRTVKHRCCSFFVSPTFPHALRLALSLCPLLTPRELMCLCTIETHQHTERKCFMN